MKVFWIKIVVAVLALALPFGSVMVKAADDEKKSEAASEGDKLKSAELDKDGQALDKQMQKVYTDMQKVITSYGFLKDELRRGITTLPYQIAFRYAKDKDKEGKEVSGTDHIAIERHKFIKSDLQNSKIVGVKNRVMKLYYSGENINKIVTEITQRNYEDDSTTIVTIVDPTPMDEKTDDITMTHIFQFDGTTKKDGSKRQIVYLDNKKLGEVQNSTAFPIKNELKRDFLVPNANYFHNVLVDIAETYFKGKKDAETIMADFLKKAQD